METEVILSILVVSHNQRHTIRRCINSILQQKIRCRYEIIISDDRSSDGTWDIIQEYQSLFPELIRGIKCNSDECNPVHVSERCGWNKLNAYSNSKGKYFVNIDADDYLTGDSIYQHQIDLLEMNPDCSLCMQRVNKVKEGDSLNNGYQWPVSSLIKEGSILSPRDVVLKKIRGLNQSYMIRKQDEIDPSVLYGKFFDDTIITLHHLQFGNVVCTEKADYIWIDHDNSITSQLIGDNDLVFHALLPLMHTALVPHFAGLFMAEENPMLLHLLTKLVKDRNLSLDSECKNYIRQFNGFIFQCVEKGSPSKHKVLRLYLIIILIGYAHYLKRSSPHFSRLLYRLLTNTSETIKIKKHEWQIR